MEKRVVIIDLENGNKIQRFEPWNADSFYFYDASGNIAEFIVRYELKNNINSDFKISDVLGVNEIGMPTNDIEKLNQELQENFGTQFWKGNAQRFGTNGAQEGLFLLPNHNIKDFWFPTSIKIKPEPFSAGIVHNGEKYFMEYINGEIKATSNNI